MAEYYLISQLPSLDGLGENAPVPITEERFLELCYRFTGKKTQEKLQKLTLIPPINPEKSNSSVIEAWNIRERSLRLALAKSRSEKLNKSFDLKNECLSVELMKVATAAVEIDNPLEAENFLSLYRLNFLEAIRPMDTFSEDFIFYYGLKLKLILRIRQLDSKLGETIYRNIYNSILSGDRLEALS